MTGAPTKKFRVGEYEGWHVGSSVWEVRDRRTGDRIATARSMNECHRRAMQLDEQQGSASKAGAAKC